MAAAGRPGRLGRPRRPGGERGGGAGPRPGSLAAAASGERSRLSSRPKRGSRGPGKGCWCWRIPRSVPSSRPQNRAGSGAGSPLGARDPRLRLRPAAELTLVKLSLLFRDIRVAHVCRPQSGGSRFALRRRPGRAGDELFGNFELSGGSWDLLPRLHSAHRLDVLYWP